MKLSNILIGKVLYDNVISYNITDNILNFVSIDDETEEYKGSVNLDTFGRLCKEYVRRETSYQGSEGYFIMSATKFDSMRNRSIAWVAPADESYDDATYIEYTAILETEVAAIIEVTSWVIENKID